MLLLRVWCYMLTVLIATCSSKVNGFWFFSCPHGNGQGQTGDTCSAFCQCHALNTCEAGVQRCAAPGVYEDRCHATRPCARGFSCHPGVQKCYHVPRRFSEPCVAGHECASGLACEPGLQLCFHRPRRYNEPCAAGFSCAPGFSCQPGVQRCLHHPRRENERCSAGFLCADGLECRLCDQSYATCQLARVPALSEEDYNRPFNKVAFLVTHNSFSNSPKFALWARNQRFSISKQLQDGVRGLMLDIYPGWGQADVRLCHGSCFWGGSTNLVDTLVDIRKFLETNDREVVTIFFEDYLRNPTILKRAFDQAGVSPHVLRDDHWGRRGLYDWPTLNDMRRLGRLVVFNNNGIRGFPYTVWNMWYYVRENRFGSPGQNKKECVDRSESRWNAGWSDRWSLVLVNWFSTAANPLQPCLNSFLDMTDKLVTCHEKFGFWANFVAVNYYSAGSGGGAFQAVKWLNDKLKREKSAGQLMKSSYIPFPMFGAVNHLHGANQDKTQEPKTLSEGRGFGSGFHHLAEILTHEGLLGENINRMITSMKHATIHEPRNLSAGSKNSSLSQLHRSHSNRHRKYRTNLVTQSLRKPSHLTRKFQEGNLSLGGGEKHASRKHKIISSKKKISRKQTILRNYQPKKKFSGNSTYYKNSQSQEEFSGNSTHSRNNQSESNHTADRRGRLTNSIQSQNGGKNMKFIQQITADKAAGNNARKNRTAKVEKVSLRKYYNSPDKPLLTNVSRRITLRRARNKGRKLPSLSSRAKNRKKAKLQSQISSQGNQPLNKKSRGKFDSRIFHAHLPMFPTRPRSSFPSTRRLKTIPRRKSPTVKIRNLQRQLARLKAKLNRLYLHVPRTHRRNGKPTPSLPIPKIQQRRKEKNI